MKYLLVHIVSEPSKTRIYDCIHQLMEDYSVFDMSGIEPHITLKYYFDTSHLSAVEAACRAAASYDWGKFTLETVDNFSKETIFLTVQPDELLRTAYQKLVRGLEDSKVPFLEHEQGGAHLHLTLAQQVPSSSFDAIVRELDAKDFSAQCSFDNLTILKFNGSDFVVHKRYEV